MGPTLALEDQITPIEPRAARLVDHADGSIRELDAGMRRELEIFKQEGDSYGDVFYILQRNK